MAEVVVGGGEKEGFYQMENSFPSLLFLPALLPSLLHKSKPHGRNDARGREARGGLAVDMSG